MSCSGESATPSCKKVLTHATYPASSHCHLMVSALTPPPVVLMPHTPNTRTHLQSQSLSCRLDIPASLKVPMNTRYTHSHPTHLFATYPPHTHTIFSTITSTTRATLDTSHLLHNTLGKVNAIRSSKILNTYSLRVTRDGTLVTFHR